MYNEHFGLQQAPFRITPDTGLFYEGGGRGGGDALFPGYDWTRRWE